MTKYERLVIKPILSTIEKYQEFLTQPENLPQLSKLGFMFEKFWYAGRLAYGCEGVIKKGYTCENNPKYELGDTIKYINEDIENLIYDAWGMHVSNDLNEMTFDEIKKLILEGKPLSEFEIKCRKPNKTFDEFVEIMTDERDKYHRLFSDRDSVADYLLCTIGTGYGYNSETGTIFKEASGADQDQDGYGDWENAKFIPEIQKVVEKILSVPELQLAIDAGVKYVIEYKEKEKRKRDEENRNYNEDIILPLLNKLREKMGVPPINSVDDPEFLNDFNDKKEKYKEKEREEREKQKKVKHIEYYPISEYSNIKKFDERTHPSYIKAAIEVCTNIVNDPPVLRENFNQYQIDNRNNMIKFAEDFLKRFNK